MKFTELLNITQEEPIFETGLLLSGSVDPNDVRRQLSRWVNQGRVQQLRRGLYAVAPPYRNFRAHPFEIANRLQPGSYVSLHSVLEVMREEAETYEEL
jgi:predicted transcriptional regulator of viral defense system